MATIWTLSGTGALWINTVGVCAMSLNFMISPKSRRLRKSHSPVFNPISWSDIPWSSHSRAPGKVWGPPAWSHDAPKTSHTSNGSGDHNRNKGAKRLSWALSLLQNQCPNQHPIIAGSYINVYIYISYNISVYFHIYVYIYIPYLFGLHHLPFTTFETAMPSYSWMTFNIQVSQSTRKFLEIKTLERDREWSTIGSVQICPAMD